MTVLVEAKDIAPSQTQGSNGSKPVMELVRTICSTLQEQQINYCHWKSNEAIDRSASGDNDLDLLISREDAARFHAILYQLGIKESFGPEDSEQPGILSYFGYDRPSGRILHVHVHYNLVLGNDFSKNYHLPFERAYLESAKLQALSQGGLFRIPAPEMELIVFVVRMVLKHSTWDTILSRSGSLSPSEKRELADLVQRADTVKLEALLARHLPFVSKDVFHACLCAIQPGCPLGQRIRAGEQMQQALRAHGRRGQSADILLKAQRRVVGGIKRRIERREQRHRLANGGAIIAFVGGDGAGKTTAIETAYKWLGRHFDIQQFHMGRPDWSPTTVLVRGLLKVGQVLRITKFTDTPLEAVYTDEEAAFPGYSWLFRQVLTSRDRWLTYRKARRFASNGGLVILDRFPLPHVMRMDGPQAERFTRSARQNWLIKTLVATENRYYQEMMLPEILFVLRLDPKVAVTRKPEESAESVFTRSSEIYGVDWNKTTAHLIDASQSKEQVLSQVKDILWENL
jgi:thymidylate kinase